jgi:hypothetical protein
MLTQREEITLSNDLNLGRLLGRREAFTVMAARCSAADAALLREMRNGKLYVDHAKDWDEFCANFLHMSKESANRVIRYLDEFGPSYFELTQITRISPKIYRMIAPAIQDHSIQHNGESIALVAENAEKISAAVHELRKAIPKETAVEPEPDDPIPAFDKRCSELVADLTRLVCQREHITRLHASIGYLRDKLNYLELTL